MRKLNHLDEFRVSYLGSKGDEYNGAFIIKIKGETYKVLASNGMGWEHISISHKHKIPSWSVMCALKDMFFEKDEVVMQLHPAEKNYVNIHQNCLHLWRPTEVDIPTPPTLLV